MVAGEGCTESIARWSGTEGLVEPLRYYALGVRQTLRWLDATPVTPQLSVEENGEIQMLALPWGIRWEALVISVRYSGSNPLPT